MKDLKFCIIILGLCVTTKYVETSGCNYPNTLQNAVWYDSERDQLTFTTNEMTGYTIQSYASSVTDWSCHIISDDYVISKGKTTVYLFGSNQDVYICMKMTKVTESSYYYYLVSDKEINANNDRVYIILSGTVVNSVSTLCSANSPQSDEEYNTLVKKDNEDLAKQWCPSAFLGNFYYTYNHGTGDSCGAGSEWDVCTNRTTMIFNYTRCPTTVAFADLSVFCVASVTSNNIQYLTVFNNGIADSVNYYRYTCIAISSSGSSLAISLQKGKCDKGQSPTSRPSGGATATLTPYFVCPFEFGDASDTTSSTAIASVIGAVFAVLLAIILIVLIFCCYMKYKDKKKVKPEQNRGHEAYFVREFTFERIQNKLRKETVDYPESVCTSVSTLEDYEEKKRTF